MSDKKLNLDVFDAPNTEAKSKKIDLSVFDAPKKSEMSDSALETFAANAGDTLGVGTKVAAGMETLREYLTNKKLPSSVGQAYEDYLRNKKYAKEAYAAAGKENKKAAALGTLANVALTSALPLGQVAEGASLGQKMVGAGKLGAAYGLGSSDIDEGDIGDAAIKTGLGFGAGALTSAATEKILAPAANYVGTKSKAGLDKLSGFLRDKAEKLAETATGATRYQAEKFADNAGGELLDRGIVKFGYSPKNIANKSGNLMAKSEQGIDNALSTLDAQGVRVTKEQIVDGLKKRIAALSEDDSQAGVVAKLQKILNGVEKGSAEKTLSLGEKVKRGFQRQSNYNKPLTTQANKAAASVFREAVEDSATRANPELAKRFIEDKKLWGLLAPINEAAEKRAIQLNQMPWGGLLDTASVLTGLSTDNKEAGLALPIVRRLIMPRTASSAAVTANMISKGVGALSRGLPGALGNEVTGAATRSAIPLFNKMEIPAAIKQVAGGKSAPEITSKDRGPQSQYIDRSKTIERVAGTPYEAPLRKALERGDNSFASTYYLMSQQYPDFRQRVESKE